MRAVAEKAKKPGVIDTLSAGFDTINRRLWIVLLPMAVDLLLWRGPHITPQPLFQRLIAWQQAALSPGETIAPSGQRVDEVLQTLEAALAGFNMLSLLVLNFVANVPNTTVGRPADTSFVITVSNETAFVLLFVLIELVGLALGCFYLGLIAQQVRDGKVSLRRLGAKLGSYCGHALALALMVLAAAAALLVPLTVLLVASVLLGGAAAQVTAGVVATALYFAALWALLFLYFAVDAIVVSEVGARRAILNSVLVVGKNFWPALGLIFLTILILTGTQIIWTSISYSSWGVMAGVVGNAYIASGLAAASMLFYSSRMAGLEENGYYKRILRRQ